MCCAVVLCYAMLRLDALCRAVGYAMLRWDALCPAVGYAVCYGRLPTWIARRTCAVLSHCDHGVNAWCERTV
jgi:hypothetical protein